MLKRLLIPSHENSYKPFFSSRVVLVIFTLWIFVFHSLSSVIISNYQIYANNLSSERIVELANVERAQRGLQPLSMNPLLTSAAYAKANHMFREQYWDHFGPNGETPWEFIRAADYDYAHAGENLGKGFTTSEGLHQAWMASVTHRDNIIHESYSDIGIAIVSGNLLDQNVVLVVQMFGTTAGEHFVKGGLDYEQGENLNGNIKSIRIVYPEDGAIYNNPRIPIKGNVTNIDSGVDIKIVSKNDLLGKTNVSEDKTWEFSNTHDWEQGEHIVEAYLPKDEGTSLSDSVSFVIDSISPALVSIDVIEQGDKYILNLEVSKYPSEISLISGENMSKIEVKEPNVQISLYKNKISGNVFLVLYDDNDNLNEVDITSHFIEEKKISFMGVNLLLTGSGIQRFVMVFFGVFILSLIAVQIYHYKKLKMLKDKGGDFLMLGVWWFILLFGIFIGYSGSVH